jgi:hypothetical protein
MRIAGLGLTDRPGSVRAALLTHEGPGDGTFTSLISSYGPMPLSRAAADSLEGIRGYGAPRYPKGPRASPKASVSIVGAYIRPGQPSYSEQHLENVEFCLLAASW